MCQVAGVCRNQHCRKIRVSWHGIADRILVFPSDFNDPIVSGSTALTTCNSEILHTPPQPAIGSHPCQPLTPVPDKPLRLPTWRYFRYKLPVCYRYLCHWVATLNVNIIRSKLVYKFRLKEFKCKLTFKRRIKSHLPFAGIIRSSPYSPRFQDNG